MRGLLQLAQSAFLAPSTLWRPAERNDADPLDECASPTLVVRAGADGCLTSVTAAVNSPLQSG